MKRLSWIISILKIARAGKSQGEVMWEGSRLTIAGFEDGGRSQEPKHVGSFRKLEEARSQILLWSPQEEHGPADTLTLAQ